MGDELDIPEFLKISQADRAAAWVEFRKEQKMQKQQEETTTNEGVSLHQKTQAYNSVVQKIIESGGEARERKLFNTHSEADQAMARIEGAWRARQDGLAQSRRASESKGVAREVRHTNGNGHGHASKSTSAPKPKKASAPRKTRPFGNDAKDELKQMRPGSNRARVLEMMAEGKHTPEQISQKLKLEEKTVLANAFCTWRDCGIGYNLDASGHLVAKFPKGKSIKDAFKE